MGNRRLAQVFTQGMSSSEESSGAAEWQTSRVPISAIALPSGRNDNEGGTTMPRTIARRTIHANHFIVVI